MAKKKSRGRPPKEDGAAELISFRLAPELIETLNKLAKGQLDETGAQISIHAYARRMIVELLTKKNKI